MLLCDRFVVVKFPPEVELMGRQKAEQTFNSLLHGHTPRVLKEEISHTEVHSSAFSHRSGRFTLQVYLILTVASQDF